MDLKEKVILTTRAVIILGFQAGNLQLAIAESGFDHTHSKWTVILQDHVVESGSESSVKYEAFKKNPHQLNSYLDSLSQVSKEHYESFTNNQKLAFLINAYNAFTVKLIIDRYPVKSIKDIGGVFSTPWKKQFFSLFGLKTHLDAIEHDMIRKSFKEPRIHFALVCASKGCPALKNKAFTATELDSQLSEVARSFLRDRKKNYFDESRKTLFLSSIFKWYGNDFSHFGSVKVFVAPIIANSDTQKKMIMHDDVKVSYLDYDWALNDTK